LQREKKMNEQTHPNRRRVDGEEIKRLLEHHPPDTELLSALEEFGRMMISEGQAHLAAIEAKGLSVLGWTSAMLALMFSKDLAVSAKLPTVVVWLTGLGVLAALAALVWAAQCVRIREWTVPSQQDWFRTDIFGSVKILRAYHLLALLESHDAHIRVQDQKSEQLRKAQWSLVLAALALGVVVVIRVFLG
jgi:hypothetical protein